MHCIPVSLVILNIACGSGSGRFQQRNRKPSRARHKTRFYDWKYVRVAVQNRTDSLYALNRRIVIIIVCVQ